MMQATTTSLPLHLKMEIERRPSAARRLGLMVPPTRQPSARQLPQVKEHDLLVHALEVERRPVAALRQGLLVRNSVRNDVPTHDVHDTEAHRMEVDRRPAAAKRQGFVAPAPTHHPADAVLARSAVPLKDTECHALEASRRPVAARRLGYIVRDLPTPAAAAAAAASPPHSFTATAAGALEAERRPVAAVRAGYTFKHVPAAPAAIKAKQLDLVDSEYYAMEASRRPHATARMQMQRAAAAAAATAAEDTTPIEVVGDGLNVHFTNNSVDVALNNYDKNDFAAAGPTAAGMKSSASEAPNPFATLERMLESRLTAENTLSGGGGSGRTSRGSSLRGAANYPGCTGGGSGRTSRGSSLRGAANYPGFNQLGSTGNLQRYASADDDVNDKKNNNVVTRRGVACAVEPESGDVVCRAQDSGDVVMTCHYDDINDLEMAGLTRSGGGDALTASSTFGAAR